MSAGVYEQLVRYLAADEGNMETQTAGCAALGVLCHQGHREPDFAAVLQRSGAVRAVCVALRTHGQRSHLLLVHAAKTLSLAFVRGSDVTAARELDAVQLLAAGLPLALRQPDVGSAHPVEFICQALLVLAADDATMTRLVSTDTLRDISAALRLRGAASLDFAQSACMLLRHLLLYASEDMCAAASDSCVAGLQAAVRAHSDLNVQQDAWTALMMLMVKDETTAARVFEAGLINDAAQMLGQLTARSPPTPQLGEPGSVLKVVSALCETLHVALRTQTLDRDLVVTAAHASVGAVHLYGAVDTLLDMRACSLVRVLVEKFPHVSGLILDDGALAAVVSVMRAQLSVVEVYMSGLATLFVLVSRALKGEYLGRSADEKARKLASTGVLEVVADALRVHVSEGDARVVRESAIETLLSVCAGCARSPGFSGPRLQPSVAARAARAGVGAAITATMALQPVIRDRDAEALAAAVNRVPAPAPAPAPRACDGCGTVEAPKLMLCARCRTARFCGAACQRAAWAEHKKACVPAAKQPAADGASSA